MVRLTPMGNESHVSTERALGEDKWLIHEWLRNGVSTIGQLNTLHNASVGHRAGSLLMEYLWFLLVSMVLMATMNKCYGPAADADDRRLHPDAPTPVIERVEWLEGGRK